MIAKTSSWKKLVFFPLTAASLIMTVMLFSTFGSNTIGKILLSTVSLGLEGLKILMLITWSNNRLLKKAYGIPLAIYIVIASVSAFASLAYGLGEIKRIEALTAGSTAKVEAIKDRIEQTQQRIIQIDKANTERRATVQEQIKQTLSQIPKLSYNLESRTRDINAEVERLNRQYVSIGKDDGRDQLSSNLESLRTELGSMMKTEMTGIEGLDVVAVEVFMTTPAKVRVWFLWIWTLLLEVGMMYSASGAISLKKENTDIKKKKKKNIDQLAFKGIKVK
jgi:hypothetical protein